jgi:hypothetical protein
MDFVNLRVAVDDVDREIADLPRGNPHGPSALQGAWSQLVGILALEPQRATRACPRCGSVGMADATLCGYCWMKLVPAHGAA